MKQKKNEYSISIKFISTEQKINCQMLCKNTDIFAIIEQNLYQKYPEYKETENFFLLHGTKINKNKTLEENKIKNNDVIILKVFDNEFI